MLESVERLPRDKTWRFGIPPKPPDMVAALNVLDRTVIGKEMRRPRRQKPWLSGVGSKRLGWLVPDAIRLMTKTRPERTGGEISYAGLQWPQKPP